MSEQELSATVTPTLAEHDAASLPPAMIAIQTGVHAVSERGVSDKITPEHISQFLHNDELSIQLDHSEKTHRMILIFALTVIAVGFILAVIHMLGDKPDVLEKVLYASGGLIAGLLGGYGIGRTQK